MKHSREANISTVRGAIQDREHLTAYLLGELPEEEQLRLEQEYFAGDAAYEQLLAVEDELAYDYLAGRLSAQRRARFESTIGATERGRGNLEFARLLLAELQCSRALAAPSRHYWAAAIAAALFLMLLPMWLALRVGSLTAEVQKLRAAGAEVQQQIAEAKRAAPLEASFLLTPGLARSGDGPLRLEVPPKTGSLRLELVLPPGAGPGDYVMAIRAPGGGEVWSRGATAAGRTVAASVPAGLLSDGAYEIGLRRLTAGEQAAELATYSARLTRK